LFYQKRGDGVSGGQAQAMKQRNKFNREAAPVFFSSPVW
jgi:hypothetical protein